MGEFLPYDFKVDQKLLFADCRDTIQKTIDSFKQTYHCKYKVKKLTRFPLFIQFNKIQLFKSNTSLERLSFSLNELVKIGFYSDTFKYL